MINIFTLFLGTAYFVSTFFSAFVSARNLKFSVVSFFFHYSKYVSRPSSYAAFDREPHSFLPLCLLYLVAFKISSLSLILNNVIMMYLGVVFFERLLWRFLEPHWFYKLINLPCLNVGRIQNTVIILVDFSIVVIKCLSLVIHKVKWFI